MNETFDLQGYLANGIERFVADVVKATLKNPRESAYMLKFAAASDVLQTDYSAKRHSV
ncbi:MAG: hypothetical protein IJH52_07655 [Oscillospiraceae bacterium]|nr:hypothetical protein [Oscillospiraceae bacterium]